MNEHKTSGVVPISELDRIIPAPRKLPKHFHDLFVNKITNRISPGIVWRNHRKGWKGLFRKPIRDVLKTSGPLSIVGLMRAFTPYLVEIPDSAKGETDASAYVCDLLDFLERNTTETWFYYWGVDCHKVLFESASDAVACRLLWKA